MGRYCAWDDFLLLARRLPGELAAGIPFVLEELQLQSMIELARERGQKVL